MHMDIVSLVINLISGAVGGNIAGAVMKDKSLGPLLNSVVGVLGGGAGAGVLKMMGMAVNEGGLDIQAVLTSVASGGVGGGILLVIVALIKGHDEEVRPPEAGIALPSNRTTDSSYHSSLPASKIGPSTQVRL